MKLKYYLRGIGVGLILTVVFYSTMIIPRKYRMTDDEVKRRAQELGMVQREEPDVDLSALSGTPAPTGEGSLTPSPSGEDVLTPSPSGEDVLTPSPTGEDALTPSPSGEDALTPSPTGEITPEADATPVPEDTPGITPPEAPEEPSPPEALLTMSPEPTSFIQPPEADIRQDGEIPGAQADATTAPPRGQEDAAQSTPDAAPTTATGNKIELTVTPGMGSADLARAAYRVGLIDDIVAFDEYLMKNNYSLSIWVGTYSIPEGATYEEIAKIVTGK